MKQAIFIAIATVVTGLFTSPITTIHAGETIQTAIPGQILIIKQEIVEQWV